VSKKVAGSVGRLSDGLRYINYFSSFSLVKRSVVLIVPKIDRGAKVSRFVAKRNTDYCI